jgi:hypothetical protein
MQQPSFSVGPRDRVAMPVAPLGHLALGIEQEVNGDAVVQGSLEVRQNSVLELVLASPAVPEGP